MTASAQRVVEIVFNAVNNTGAALGSIASGIDKATASVGNISAPLSDLADKILEAQTAIVSLGAVFLGVATQEAAVFGEKIEEIGSLVNATPEQLDTLKKSVQDFALGSVSNFEQIGDAVYKATSNFGSLDKAMSALEIAEQGSIVGATSLDDSMGALSKTMNAYGLSTGTAEEVSKSAKEVMAALFVTVQNGDINMTELSASIGKVAATAAASKVPIDQVGAAVAALTGAGISPEESMTKLTALLRELLKPSDDLKKALGGLSVETDGLPAVFEKLKTATGGTAEKINEIFSSSEAASSAIVLINDNAGKFGTTLEAMKTKVQAFNDNVASMSGGLVDSEQKFENAGKVLLQKLGAPLENGSQNLVDSIANIFQGLIISFDNGAFDEVYAALKIAGKTITDNLNAIAENLPTALENVDFSQLIAAFGDLSGAFSGLFDGIDLTTADGLAKAIQFVVDSITSLTEVSSGIIETWMPVVKAMLEGVDAFNALDDTSKQAAGNLLGVSQIFESIKGYIEGGSGALEKLANAFQFLAAAEISTSMTRVAMALLDIAPAAATATAALVGVAAVAAGAVIAYGDYQAHSEAMAAADKETAKTLEAIELKYRNISDATGIAVQSGQELQAEIKAGNIVFNEASKAYQNTADFLQAVSTSTGLTITSTAQLSKAIAEGSIVLDKASGTYTTYQQQLDAAAEKTQQNLLINGGFAESVDKLGLSLGATNAAGEKLVMVYATLEKAERRAMEAHKQGQQVFVRYESGMYQVISTGEKLKDSAKAVTQATEDVSKANIKGSEEWARVHESMQSAKDSAIEFQLKAQELSEKKYEAVLTANVDLKVAQIEADTQRISAALGSLNTGITSTGSTLVDLTDILNQSSNLDEAKQNKIKDLVDAENARRQAEFNLQKRLIENQNKILEAKTKRLLSKAPLITIDAKNLDSELGVLFEKVLKLAQIKGTEEGIDLLLGF